jgi:leucyl-tRNA synthetase
MMEMVNALYKIKESDGMGHSDAWQFALESLLQILAPFAPHITEELWHELGHEDTIHRDHWPKWDDALIQSDTMTIIVQVNGKLRAKLDVATDTGAEEVKKLALADENVQKFVTAEPRKVIYVPGKLVNIVA